MGWLDLSKYRNKYQLTVTTAKGVELDKQEFISKESAESYQSSEWSDTDHCVEILRIEETQL
tara:strand:- start:109 stop:294 length:186 start_codon:yes stop_codon:yes gene_type:complete